MVLDLDESPCSSPEVRAIGKTFGAVFVGMCVGLMMYGLSAHQTWLYFRMYSGDKRILRTIVIVLFSADTFHSVLTILVCYHYLVASFANPSALLYGDWSIRVITPVSSIIILTGQGFYARRVYQLRGNLRYVSMVAGVFVFVAGGFSAAATIESFIRATYAEWQHWIWLTSAAFASSLVAEVILVFTLVNFLRKSQTGIKRTDSMLRVLVVYTINAGLLTCTLSSLCMIFALAQPKTMIYVALNMPATKAYSNSVLAVLNSRKSLVDLTRSDDFGTLGMSVLQHNPSGGFARMRRMPVPRSILDIEFNVKSELRTQDSTGSGIELPVRRSKEADEVAESSAVTLSRANSSTETTS